MTATPTGGYYEVASDGGLFAFGPGVTFALEEIDDPTAVEVDQGGGVDGGMGGVGGQVAVLVGAQSPDHPDTASVFHERGALDPDRRPGGVPAHAILGSHRGDRAAQLADLAGHLGAGAQGEDETGGRCPPASRSTSS